MAVVGDYFALMAVAMIVCDSRLVAGSGIAIWVRDLLPLFFSRTEG